MAKKKEEVINEPEIINIPKAEPLFEEKIVSVSESDSLQRKGCVVVEIFVDKATGEKMHKIQIPK